MAQVQRWLAKNQKFPSQFKLIRVDQEPYHSSMATNYLRPEDVPAGHGWLCFRGSYDLKWPESWGYPMIPIGLFSRLKSGIFGSERGSHMVYDSIREAEESLAEAWSEAVRPNRWFEVWRRPWNPEVPMGHLGNPMKYPSWTEPGNNPM